MRTDAADRTAVARQLMLAECLQAEIPWLWGALWSYTSDDRLSWGLSHYFDMYSSFLDQEQNEDCECRSRVVLRGQGGELHPWPHTLG